VLQTSARATNTLARYDADIRRDRAIPAVVPMQSKAKRAVSNVARASMFASKSAETLSAGSERPSGGAGASFAGPVSPCSCFERGQMQEVIEGNMGGLN
jgi:hypothetical protein